jgi:hypothetical protein
MSGTVFGYLWALFMVGFITFFYWISNNVFGWWSPAENMVDPNVLALPLPWLLPAAQSLQAGFWEECLFRAVPLAGAVLIGKNFRRKGIWIAAVLILQAAIFGSLHANYAQQPAYARIVEMLIPFVLYGLIYINWGLLPVVVSHFVYDIVLMAMPLFILSAPGIWLHRIFAILAALVPLLVVVYRRLRAGSWYELREGDLNKGFRPEKPVKKDKAPAREFAVKEGKAPGAHYRSYPFAAALVLIAVSAAAWILLTPFEQDIPSLGIDRREAVKIADSLKEQRYAGMDTLGAKAYVMLDTDLRGGDRFAWENSETGEFRELYGHTLGVNYFTVTYKTFEGNAERRSETLKVRVGRDGEILGWEHHVPESRAGAELDEDTARRIAEKALTAHFGLSPGELQAVRVLPEKLNARKDWQFIYRRTDPVLEEGYVQYAATVSGAELSGLASDVHVSESWEREQKRESTRRLIMTVISTLIRSGMLIALLIMGVIAWTRKHFDLRIFLYVLISLFLLSLLQTLLLSNSVFARYPTSEPFSNLMIIFITGAVIGSAFSALLFAIPAGYMAVLPLPVHRNSEQVWVKGLSLGLFFAALTAFAQSTLFRDLPRHLAPAALDSRMPWLSALSASAEGYLTLFIRLLVPFVLVHLLTAAWEKRKVPALLVLFVSGFMFAGRLPLEWWLLNGALFGGLMIALYLLIMRYNMIYIPVMAGALMLLDAAQYALTDPAVFTAGYVIIKSVVSMLLTWLCVQAMHRLRLLQPR